MAIFDALKTSRIELNVQSLENATYAIEGTDLIITVPGEQEAIVINNFAVAVESGAPLELVTNDGVVAELEELQAAIDASSIGEVAPAAGPQGGTGGTGGGAGFAPNQNEGIGEGLGVDGLLSGTSLDLGGETEGEALQPLIIESAASVETDPCNAMFEDKVAAFRDSFRSEPEFDNPNGFKYYQKDYIVSGDGNDPEHNSFDPSNSFDHGIDLTIEGSLSQSNDVMNASNIEEETHVIVGDEFIDENTYHYNGDVDASAEFIGNNQTVSVFNDNITGTEETIAIFGDTLIESQPYYQGNFDLNSQFDFSANDDETGSTNNNTMTVYGDEIVAGANTQTIAGDIGRATADWDFDNYYPTQIGISVTHSFSDDDGSTEARNNVYVANEDLIDASGVTPSMSYFGVGTVISGDALSGGTDLIDDNIYGGVQRIGETTGPLYISLTTEYTVSLTGDSVYSDNEMRSMNDLIIGSDGLDLIAGDALIMSDDMYGGFGNDSSVSGVEIDFEVDLQATGSVDYSYDSDENLTLDIKDGSTIENNKFSGHNDVIDGGAGADFIAGDVALMTQNYLQFEGGEPSVVTLDVDVSFDAVGSTRYFGSEEEQEGPFTAEGGIIRNNEINVFNDIIRGDDGTVQDGTFGDGMYGSTDFLVGDVLALDTNGTIIEFEASFSVSEAYNDDPQNDRK
ncbi:hypothetical protein [Sneathiella glossodoripedis]|uniref:hypothetical protein n=1 Tax=Sneathiella glossodoripedis TaxID=418853 RepID=UPI00046E8E10|nr:hypothetical protein [Sneathiella glossodoripedis]